MNSEARIQRIAVLGCCGSGKTRLAVQLGQQLGLPVFHLDQLYFEAGWTPVPPETFRARQADVLAREQWILDGNYLSVAPERLAAADVAVFLDVSPLVCWWRLFCRWCFYRFRGPRVRPDTAPDCPETLSLQLMRWVWTYHRSMRPQVLEALSKAGREGKAVYHLRGRNDVHKLAGQLLGR